MPTIKVCTGRTCSQHSSIYLIDRARAEIGENSPVKLETCGCLGQCEKAPAVAVEQGTNKTLHCQMDGPKMGALARRLKAQR